MNVNRTRWIASVEIYPTGLLEVDREIGIGDRHECPQRSQAISAFRRAPCEAL